MNFNPEKHMLELKEAMARNEAAQSVNIMYELEREFNRVFAATSDASMAVRGGNGVDPEKASEFSRKQNRSVK